MTPFGLRLVAALCATAIAGPALGQMDHGRMHMPGMAMPAANTVPRKAPVRKAVPRKVAAKKTTKAAPARKAAAKKIAPAKARRPAATSHAAHHKSAKPVDTGKADPHAGHDMSAMPGMVTPTADRHAGHDMSEMSAAPAAGTDHVAGNAPPPPVPTDHAADSVYGAEAMAMGRHHLGMMHGGQKFSRIMLNVAEYQARRGGDGFEWDGEAWFGGDIDRLSIKSQGEATVGRGTEKAEVQALYSHAIGPYFNLQGGIRYDVRPDPSRAFAVIGVEGLAPRFFEVEGALFLSNKGEVLARAEGYYDQRITQRLILQPRAEVNLSAQNSRATRVGAGLSDVQLALRLRYEIKREFAPYVGVRYRRSLGKTRDYERDAGERDGGLSLLAGIRMWF